MLMNKVTLLEPIIRSAVGSFSEAVVTFSIKAYMVSSLLKHGFFFLLAGANNGDLIGF